MIFHLSLFPEKFNDNIFQKMQKMPKTRPMRIFWKNQKKLMSQILEKYKQTDSD